MTNTCKICNNSANNQEFEIKEHMFATHESFKYFQCSSCGCFQLADFIEDMSKYYPENYYSYSIQFNNLAGKIKRLKLFLVNHILKHVGYWELGRPDFIGKLGCHKEYYRYYFKWLGFAKLNKDSMILDVGCGQGLLLRRLALMGYNNLHGIDPYLKDDIIFSKYKIEKKNISDIAGEYDFIMLNHSFEHINNPHDTIEYLKKALHKNGTMLIRIPLIDSFAFEKYRENWFQLDAPRHLFIYSVKSMELLAEMHGLNICNIIYDSTSKQFVFSERYKKGLSINDAQLSFSKKQINIFQHEAELLNKECRGDQACFFLQRKI